MVAVRRCSLGPPDPTVKEDAACFSVQAGIKIVAMML